MIRVVHPRSRIRKLTFSPSRIPDPGVKKAPDPGSGSATLHLPMNKEPFPFPVHEVLLHFGDVVTDVIDDVHVQVVGGGLEHLGEGLARQEGHAAPVDPGEVGRRRHTVQVLLPLLPPKQK